MNRLLPTLLLVISTFPVCAAGENVMFDQGRTHVSLVGGNGYAYGNNYSVIGASASYYVADGMGVGLSLESWSGGGPGIIKYAPFVQYVFYQTSEVQPYVGAIYRHTSISGLPGINSLGVRAGFIMSSGANAYVSAGMIHESYLDCQTTVYRTCRTTYPDISLTFGF